MNRQASDAAAPVSIELSEAVVADPALLSGGSTSKANYEDVLSEKRSRWLFRIQFCLILSILAHIALLAYIHDKFIKLEVSRSDNHRALDEITEERIPLPVKESKVISGYDESRLDSPLIQDSFEQLTPSSPAEEQEFNDEKNMPSVDEIDASFEHEYQIPDSPVESEISNISPVDVNDIEAPTEEVLPDVSRTYEMQFNPSNVQRSVPLPEHEQQVLTVERERPQSDIGAMRQESVMPDSSNVALDVENLDVIRPIEDDSSTLDIQDFNDIQEMNDDIPELNPSSVPELVQPVKSVRPVVVSRPRDIAILSKSDSALPKPQTRMPVSKNSGGTPRASSDSSTAYIDQVSNDISRSIILDPPKRPTSVSIPRDSNSGFGGLSGDEIRGLDALPESSIATAPPSIASPTRTRFVPSDAYKKRSPNLRPQMITTFGGNVEINQSIENGLKYISKTQWPDGRWRFHQQPATLHLSQELQQNGNIQCDTAATALSLLSMLGAGYTHKEGMYKNEIQKGLNYLIQNQQTIPVRGNNGKLGAVGALFNKETDTDINSYSYAHAMASTALCEAYGLTHDPALLPAAQAAIRYIIATQNPTHGGWRYETVDREGQPHKESDTSSSGWQVMALRSAMAAEVLKPDEIIPVLNKAQTWLDRAQDPENKRYIYNPDNGTDSKYADWKKTTPAMTAEGLFMQWCINPDLMDSQQNIQYLLQNTPGKKGDSKYSSDVYYWYYATAVMFAQKGEAWKTWQSAIMPRLQNSQLPEGHPCAGSWDVTKPSLDKWSHIGGKHYMTTMNLMIMEIYIRNLSIYQ